MKHLSIILFFVAALLTPAGAQSDAAPAALDAATKSIDTDLQKALTDLAALRDQIAKEKPPLATEAEKVAADLREKRRKADLARTTREAAEREAEKAESDIKAWRDEKLYIESLLGDFQRSILLSTPLSGATREQKGETDPVAMATKLADELASPGVHAQSGEIIGLGGSLMEGTYAKTGPVQFFLSTDKKSGGLVGDGPDLRLRIVKEVQADTVASLLDGQLANLELDPSMGLALELENTKDNILTHTQKGGFWIYPILLLALISLLCAIVKWLQLSKIKAVAATAVQSIIDAVNGGNSAGAKAKSSKVQHPARQILDQGIDFMEENASVSRNDLEEALYEKYLEAGPPLQRWLPPIAIAAATAPLLGLLGTVTGMMETFRLITVFGSGDAKQLASGIAEALITTEYGLIVAIPSLIFHALLTRKVQGIKAAMEMTSLAFLNGVKTDESSESVSTGA